MRCKLLISLGLYAQLIDVECSNKLFIKQWWHWYSNGDSLEECYEIILDIITLPYLSGMDNIISTTQLVVLDPQWSNKKK